MAFSKEIPAYPGIGYLLLAGLCPCGRPQWVQAV